MASRFTKKRKSRNGDVQVYDPNLSAWVLWSSAMCSPAELNAMPCSDGSFTTHGGAGNSFEGGGGDFGGSGASASYDSSSSSSCDSGGGGGSCGGD